MFCFFDITALQTNMGKMGKPLLLLFAFVASCEYLRISQCPNNLSKSCDLLQCTSSKSNNDTVLSGQKPMWLRFTVIYRGEFTNFVLFAFLSLTCWFIFVFSVAYCNSVPVINMNVEEVSEDVPVGLYISPNFSLNVFAQSDFVFFYAWM